MTGKQIGGHPDKVWSWVTMAVTNSKMRHIECGLRPDTVARLMKSAVALSALSHFVVTGGFAPPR
jgi:hypothetical protein